MSSEEVLRSSEASALNGEQFYTHVNGKNTGGSSKKLKPIGATVFIVAMILVFGFFLGSGNLIPSMISQRLVEETDVQYADAVESKLLVFQQTLAEGEVPENTVQRLKGYNVLVGKVVDGGFNEDSGGTALLYNNEIIPAKNFIQAVKSDVGLYNAFNSATYSRAAYYYDDAARTVFRKIGTNRNNYSSEDDFDEVMNELLGEGSNIDVNNVALQAMNCEDADGEETVCYDYTETGAGVDSKAANFVEAVRAKNTASTQDEATLNAANTINVADTVAKEQKSSLFFLAFMENISKMKAGEGNDSKINEVMNYLYAETESSVVDVNTGEVVTVTGSMLESPSLYAVLSGEKVRVNEVENYASDRVLNTVENRIDTEASSTTILTTVSSIANKIKGTIGRFLSSGSEAASADALKSVTPTVDSSLVNNSFNDIKGVGAGELLVEGAVNVGKELAKASGASAGDAAAVKSYARVTSSILALDAKVDRMNRNPFDITSPNTFLGSVVYKTAKIMSKNSTLLGQLSSVMKVTAGAISSLLPATYADDESELYLENFGNCKTIGTIGAVGSAGCSMVATFDTSTLNDIFDNDEFSTFVNNNTELKNGKRTIKNNSDLANFIKYNDERITPVGVTDGGILRALSGGGGSIPFISDILAMIKTYLGASEKDKTMASGAVFVNSTANTSWQTYKYAQRYVSLARAADALKQYDGGDTAYNNLQFFEGDENPVIAFLNQYYNVASR